MDIHIYVCISISCFLSILNVFRKMNMHILHKCMAVCKHVSKDIHIRNIDIDMEASVI